jgi:hypothetical protein
MPTVNRCVFVAESGILPKQVWAFIWFVETATAEDYFHRCERFYKSVRLVHESFFMRVRKQSQGPQFISRLARTGVMAKLQTEPCQNMK